MCTTMYASTLAFMDIYEHIATFLLGGTPNIDVIDANPTETASTHGYHLAT
jgi:hypothetical protein